MSQKRIKRIKNTNIQYEEAVYEKVAEENLQHRPDEELFVVDTIGSKTKKRKIQQEIKNQENNTVSTVEQKIVQKLIKNPPIVSIKVSKKAVHDIWDDNIGNNDQQVSGRTRQSPQKPNISIPVPGQSYNPSSNDHQVVLSKALEVEVKRREKEAEMRIPFVPILPTSLTSEDRLDDDHNSGYESDEYSVDADDDSGMRKSKNKERLTRAQRNKQRAKKDAANIRKEIQVESSFLKSIYQLPTIAKDFAKKEKEAMKKAALRSMRKQSASDEVTIDPNLVPLSDELTGSLRQIIPKGIALRLQSLEMSKKGIMMVKDRRKRQKKDKPHGAKKVVWIPKYKYRV